MQNLYDPITNPDGAIPLNVAENKLSWPLLKEKMEEVVRSNPIPDWVPGYTFATGSLEFRKAMSVFLENCLCHCPIDPEHLGFSAGATATIEVTSWLLGLKGDVAVFPAPCYPVYKQDIGNKARLERYDLITHHHLESIKEQPALEIHHLENALQDINQQGNRFRMLVITNPDNPTGGVYPKEKLESIAQWCIDRKIHLIVNEIYGLSLIQTDHSELKEDYPTDIPFVSFAQIMKKKKSDYLHLWYALSKDMGASGFRVGMVYSQNQDFIEAFNNINPPHMVSNYTQWIFQLILSDLDFMKNYIQKNQELLTLSYLIVVKTLRKFDIPYAASRGSLFVWLDLSKYLEQQSQEAENKQWMEIYQSTGVLLTPGQGFGHSKKGQYRLVYSCVDRATLEVAMKRLEAWFPNLPEK